MVRGKFLRSRKHKNMYNFSTKEKKIFIVQCRMHDIPNACIVKKGSFFACLFVFQEIVFCKKESRETANKETHRQRGARREKQTQKRGGRSWIVKNCSNSE